MAAIEASGHATRRAAGEMPRPPALDRLCEAFGLTGFERAVVVLCAGMAMRSEMAEVCARHGARGGRPTLGFALAALPDAHWSALAPDAPLRYWRLVELDPGPMLTERPMRLDERVLHFLAGVESLDERLQGLVQPAPSAGDLAATRQALAERIAALWGSLEPGRAWPPVQLCGGDGDARRRVAAAACASLGVGLSLLPSAAVPRAAAERDEMARLWNREAALRETALLLECADEDTADGTAAVADLAGRLQGAVLLGAGEPLSAPGLAAVRLDVEPLQPCEQRALWERALGPLAARLDGHLGRLAAQFRLTEPDILGASAAAAPAWLSPQAAADAAWEACRAQARPRVDRLAERVVSPAGWDDLVLPQPQRETLRDIAAHVRNRARVYQDWGFERRGARGLGISALFAGPSGTGKTMAAEVLANDLRLDLYRIDLSRVVSKYIGETEKNLSRVFDAAEAGGAVLLFDEADALFGKRTEVRDSHDRYANIEVSYLLQRMECYRGLAVLTTNMKAALDPAFLRRIRFVVQFPFPDASARARIWRRAFPDAVPREGLEPERLAQLNVPGGSIRNMALHAAFLAAEAGGPVRMAHLLRAARAEYGKLERSLTEPEVRGWT
ncbi:MAG: ATP-binding protein [Chthonomonadales bacterium]|nr:ATP-binding protein [Chthonomonadales bacterium]